MTTGDQWCGLLADDVQLPSSANLRAKPRISRSAWTARRSNDLITTVPGFFREADFLDRVRLDKEYQRWSHDSFSRRVIGRACPYFAIEPC
jgi:hypothetical protein